MRQRTPAHLLKGSDEVLEGVLFELLSGITNLEGMCLLKLRANLESQWNGHVSVLLI